MSMVNTFIVLFVFTLGSSKYNEAAEIPQEWVTQLRAFCSIAERTRFSVIVFEIQFPDNVEVSGAYQYI